MKKLTVVVINLLIISVFNNSSFAIQTRIKDVVTVDGIHEAKLFGMGLVTGLNNTGDKQSQVTQRFVENMIQNMGITMELDRLDTKNTAVVTVTAVLPPFAKIGSEIDVQIDSLQTATSLQGGTLLPTPLFHPLDATKEVYVMAGGVISLGGYGASSGGDSIQKNHPTAGTVPNGGIVHKAMRLDVFEGEELVLVPYHADYTTAVNIADAINNELSYTPKPATTVDSGSVRVIIPSILQNADENIYTDNVIRFLAQIGDLKIIIDRPARVVIDEKTGTVVIGSNVAISEVAVTHGSLFVTINTETDISQPSPATAGQTIVSSETDIITQESEGWLTEIPESTTVANVVDSLNALGATPRELISILQNIEKNGSLHAKLIIR
ncbi:MAG: flagellar basal body P-ring protein FlgI [Candidatus Poribacteria bacterium]|jgi:flagellar P-ring protein precursor FlgI|nr:flagellar basal body P-ring protein FlgI [Candidatus Poribacteria bacterium]